MHVAPPQFAAHVQTPGLEHQPPLKHPDGQTAEGEYGRSNNKLKVVRQNSRVAHREPVHVDGHVHVFPALHVPPLEHTGEQTARKRQQMFK